MRKQLETAPVIVLLLGIVAVLGALNWQMLSSSVDISPLAPARGDTEVPPPSSIDLATPLDKKTATQFGQMVDRPLFNPSRKPVKRDVPAAIGPDTHPGELKLIGMMKAGDRPPRALIRSANARSGKWITEGEEFEGWTLRKIGVRSVTVESGGQSHELALAQSRRTVEDGSNSEPGSADDRRSHQ